MAFEEIGSNVYPKAKIPQMTEDADIVAALKYYHWGQATEPEENSITGGIAFHLDELDERIGDLETDIANVVLKSEIDAKGDLIVGSADNTINHKLE